MIAPAASASATTVTVTPAGGCASVTPNTISTSPKAAHGTQRLTEGACHNIHLSFHVMMFGSSPAVWANNACGVGLIDHEPGSVPMTNLDELRQGSNISIHAEYAVQDH